MVNIVKPHITTISRNYIAPTCIV